MLKKPQYIVLVIVVLLWALFFKLPGETMGKFKLAISGLFLPLFGLVATSHQAGEKAGEILTSKSEAFRQNHELRLENQKLQIAAQQAEGVWRENARLRQLVGWPQQTRWKNKLRLARIISRDPATWWRSVQIDLGRRDGVQMNCPVMTTNGLVGRVQLVGDGRSQVILLGDPALRVAALVQGSRESGVVMSSATSPQEFNMVDLGFLSGGSAVVPGQLVETWGVDGALFPPHIPIGKVVDVHSKDYGLATEARVKLFANMGGLEEVWVMLP